MEAIILAYAESGAPVGSEFLWEHYGFGVSPATIRNVMVNLEEQGLITHPHTSAGRVPTDRGYRYYVDLLMKPGRLMPEEETGIDSFRQPSAAGYPQLEDPFQTLGPAARLLADLTGEVGLVLVPELAHGSFRRLEFISVDRREVVGVLIATEGLVKHAMLVLEEPVDQEELGRIGRFLNQELAGMPLGQIHAYLERCLLETSGSFFHLYKRAMDLLSLGPFFEEEASLILEGTHRVLEAPEFRDIGRTRQLLETLERKEELIEILRKDLAADEVKVHIGGENREPALCSCTIVAAPYRLRGGIMGALGVLGPTRINYPKVTTMVGRMAQAVTHGS